VTDATEVIDVLLNHNVRCVLQGHTHINEEIDFRGIQFSTSGAVCGDWWKGPRAGSPEGFSVVSLSADGNVRREYKPYGFHALGL
jgi:3',5'-cyclic-AMP phosphodiesterase